MRILITGADGLLGVDLSRVAKRDHEVFDFPHRLLDVRDYSTVVAAVKRVKPDVVVNCAAYTDVDRAEGVGHKEAWLVNTGGARYVAQAAVNAGAWIIQLSTSAVFDGEKHSPYVESDATAPLNVYGSSKLWGEFDVQAAAPKSHTIVRTSWLFGSGRCYLSTILRKGAGEGRVQVVEDRGSPTYSVDLARAIVEMAETRPLGVVHVANTGECSRAELTRAAFDLAGIDAEIERCETSDLYPAPRSTYSVLRSERDDAPQTRGWVLALEDFMGSR